MKSSELVIWELGATIRNVKNASISYLGVYAKDNVGDQKFGCRRKADVDGLMGALFDLSLTSCISGVKVISRVGYQHCTLAVWVSPFEDGQTNITPEVIEAFSELKWAK